MKRFIIIMLAMLAFGAVNAQSVKQFDAKTYQSVKGTHTSSGASYVATDIKYIDTDNKTYVVYEHTFTKGARKGQKAYFIQRVSKKTGKPYWKEIKLS